MAKFTLWHCHLNPKSGRNEPLFVVVPGITCETCDKAKNILAGRNKKMVKKEARHDHEFVANILEKSGRGAGDRGPKRGRKETDGE